MALTDPDDWIDPDRERAGDVDRGDEGPAGRVLDRPAGDRPPAGDLIGRARGHDELALGEVSSTGQLAELPRETVGGADGDRDPSRLRHPLGHGLLPRLGVEQLAGRAE